MVTWRSRQAESFPTSAKLRLAGFAELVAPAIASYEARAALGRQASTDPLTGIANRRAFNERLDAEIGRSHRHRHSLSLAVLDLDNFKAMNDAHGHSAGDSVLVEVARRLAAVARGEDLVGRLGGDEFAWLLPETDIASATAAARPGDDAGVVHRGADDALYLAKDDGRNRVATVDATDDGRPQPGKVS